MRKIIFLTIIFLLSFVAVSIAEENDFRNTKWGMSYNEVLENEKATKIGTGNDTLFYNATIFENECYIIYEFNNENGELYRASYLYENLDDTTLKELYKKINTVIGNKYQKHFINTKKNNESVVYENKSSIITIYYNEQLQITYMDKKYHSCPNKASSSKNDADQF